MNLILKSAHCLVLLTFALWLAVPAFADDGDGASLCQGELCPLEGPVEFGVTRDHSRPGSVIIFPKFVSGGVDTACGTGNIFVDGVCLPRTEVELGATCPTRFTVGDQAGTPCPEHDPVRVRFRWVCPGTERNFTCKATGFDVLLTVDGKVVFTANGFMLPDANQVRVPAAPCDRGYLIGWVIDEFGEPKKYDGLIGEAVIRNSGTAITAYRGITIQAYAETNPGDPIKLVSDPLGSQRLGLPFSGGPTVSLLSSSPYRVITGQVTGDVTFDRPPPSADPGFGVSSSIILLTLDVRSNSPNFPTFVDLDFWNGFETRLSTFVEFVCWGEFQLSTDINPNLTQALMGTRQGIVQSAEAEKVPIGNIADSAQSTTLLGLIQTSEIPASGRPARSRIVEFYNNGIRFPITIFFP
jgi:hypothetical protein